MKKLALAALAGALCALAPVGMIDAAGGGDAKQAAELYHKADQLEWFEANNMKKVDAMYQAAADMGSPHAKMAMANYGLHMAPAGGAEHKNLVAKLCPEMARIVKNWGGTAEADAMFHIARYYLLPWCPGRDVAKGREYLLKAAEAGSPKAQYFMSKASMQDAEAAAAWLAKAADQGFPQALANLGSCYLLGLGVKQDKKKGIELIARAEATGNPNALYDIAIWRLEGKRGLPKDPAQAKRILRRLADEDYSPAAAVLQEIARGK